jgi:hypothetical protein
MVLASGLSMASVIATAADPAPPVVAPTEDGMTAFALQWFVRLQAGEIDRTQYTAAYSAQLSDSAVQAMSHQLNKYGASPLRAEIMRKRDRRSDILPSEVHFSAWRCRERSVWLRQRGQD